MKGPIRLSMNCHLWWIKCNITPENPFSTGMNTSLYILTFLVRIITVNTIFGMCSLTNTQPTVWSEPRNTVEFCKIFLVVSRAASEILRNRLVKLRTGSGPIRNVVWQVAPQRIMYQSLVVVQLYILQRRNNQGCKMLLELKFSGLLCNKNNDSGTWSIKQWEAAF